MSAFRKGDRIKLNPRFAAVLNAHPRCKIDWTVRTGVVRFANAHDVTVSWDGRVTDDKLPIRALELLA